MDEITDELILKVITQFGRAKQVFLKSNFRNSRKNFHVATVKQNLSFWKTENLALSMSDTASSF
jgi:hypothetical protein